MKKACIGSCVPSSFKKALREMLNASSSMYDNEVGNASLRTDYEVGFYDPVVSMLLFIIPLQYFAEMSP